METKIYIDEMFEMTCPKEAQRLLCRVLRSSGIEGVMGQDEKGHFVTYLTPSKEDFVFMPV